MRRPSKCNLHGAKSNYGIAIHGNAADWSRKVTTSADTYVADVLQLVLGETVLRFLEMPARYADQRDAKYQIYCTLKKYLPTDTVVWSEIKTSTANLFDVGVVGPLMPGTIPSDNCHLRVGIDVIEQCEQLDRIRIEQSLLRLSCYRKRRMSLSGRFVGLVIVFTKAGVLNKDSDNRLEDDGIVLQDGIALHLLSPQSPCWKSGQID